MREVNAFLIRRDSEDSNLHSHTIRDEGGSVREDDSDSA